MKREQVAFNPRLAGQITRYHVWPVHRHQSIGEHTFQCLRIYWQIWGPLPPEVSTALIWHDLGEMATGDLPFPVKALNPGLKEVTDRLERTAVLKMEGVLNTGELTDTQRTRMKVADLIDMYEFGASEKRMGNNYAQPIVDDCWDAIMALVEKKLPGDKAQVLEYLYRGL